MAAMPKSAFLRFTVNPIHDVRQAIHTALHSVTLTEGMPFQGTSRDDQD